MIRSEYLRFLKTLTGEDVSADMRKIANLVLNHLDTLIPLSTSQGQRIKKVASLAKANWGTINADIKSTPQQMTYSLCWHNLVKVNLEIHTLSFLIFV